MMGRREGEQGQFFYSFHLDKVVPPDHLVRQIDGLLDLDDRFREICDYGTGRIGGTDGLLADSSFAVGETRSCIMAGWRRAVELAMSDEVVDDAALGAPCART